ncbi:hypothetical protein PF004_g29356 [Phytophthora fragariae]|uniref:Uncharacterized protein n=1 Tax=Phytophthora fragariae TaxID=53985 RepID=A0A6G0MF03_9STRA|nr:hypothetical protein PF004_g29356 [Phytophthora fragariae]
MSFDYIGDDYIESEARRQRRWRALGVQLIAFLTWSGQTKARAITNHV